MMQRAQNIKNLNFEKNCMLDTNLEKVTNWSEEKQLLGKIILEILYDCGAIKTWYRDNPEGWILRSKLWSPVYISLRDISSKGNGALILGAIGKSLSKLIINEIPNFDKVLGLATTGIQIVTAITMCSNIPSLYTRKLENDNNFENFDLILKKYGEHNLIEGEMKDNEIVVIVDDLVTKFKSVIFGRKQLYYEANKRNCNITCDNAVVLIDREQGAELVARKENMNLHSLIKFKSNLHWLKDKLAPIEYQILNDYFKDYSKFQNNNEIKDIISLAK
ncbi:MAG: orotate phosphoribosyltransferase [Candidatus Odinarchaeota archaeon]